MSSFFWTCIIQKIQVRKPPCYHCLSAKAFDWPLWVPLVKFGFLIWCVLSSSLVSNIPITYRGQSKEIYWCLNNNIFQLNDQSFRAGNSINKLINILTLQVWFIYSCSLPIRNTTIIMSLFFSLLKEFYFLQPIWPLANAFNPLGRRVFRIQVGEFNSVHNVWLIYMWILKKPIEL